MIQNKTARRISLGWYDGGGSALYQFGSSGTYLVENHLRYLQEVERALHPEYDLYPGELTKRQERELIAVKDYFSRQGEMIGIKTEWHKHVLYAYFIPYVSNDTPYVLKNKIKPLYYLK